MSYEALRKLFLRDRFLCLPEFVATAKMQEIRESNLMAKNLDVHFSAFSCKHIPVTRHLVGSGESSEVEVTPRVSPPKPGISNYSKSNFNYYPRKRDFSRLGEQTHLKSSPFNPRILTMDILPLHMVPML